MSIAPELDDIIEQQDKSLEAAWKRQRNLVAENTALREVVEIVRELVGDYTITDKRLIKALEGTNET